MTLNNLSSEQQEFVHLALSGKNVLCDACIGSGKTSTINVLCDAYPPERRILYLTYNRLLKLDAKDKIKNHNVLVQNYHGFASLLLNKKGIRNCGQGEQLAMVLEKKIPIPPIDTLIIDEYQDINDEIAELLKYIRSKNPGLQIVAVGDMKQKIYDDTALDVWEFMQDFLGRHEQVVFTKCFRISHDLAERLGNIWGKTINGVNSSCIVEQMSVDEVTEFLNKQNPKNVLCLGARIGAMTKVLNDLENRPENLYDKHHVYASIADNDGNKAVAPSSDVGIFTTFDGSKGMERPICVVFDFTEEYWSSRTSKPMARYEILRNLFCVAASRGKQRIIFVNSDHPLSDKSLMTPTETLRGFPHPFAFSEMFDHKFIEDVDACYKLLEVTPIEHNDNTTIDVQAADAMIDLSPCISIYMQAGFFNSYDIDDALAYYMDLHKDMQYLKIKKGATVEDKVLLLTVLETRLYIYNAERGGYYVTYSANRDFMTEVTNEELKRYPEELRPQLTGKLMKIDISEPSYKELLQNYAGYKNAKNDSTKLFYYNMFRQGLDILDLDDFTYQMLEMNPNSMGFWFPPLVEGLYGSAFFKVPDTKILRVPITMLQLTRLGFETLNPVTKEIVNRYCQKVFHLDGYEDYFIKTGTYSSKYEFRNAHIHNPKEINEMGEYFLFLNHLTCSMASPLNNRCFYGANTTNEWVVREYIKDKENNPTIYNGLPLHTEYRVFVDFDTKEILGASPYWRSDVMKNEFKKVSSPQERHDYVVYKMHEDILNQRYHESVQTVLAELKKVIPRIELTGQWSVDVMRNGNDYYIIDMALAENSALNDCVPSNRLRAYPQQWLPGESNN